MHLLLLLYALLAFQEPVAVRQPGLPEQAADPEFDARVKEPAYGRTHPKVLFDEAHHNFHTAAGRYKPFADLITSDGYQITPSQKPFTKESLKGYDLLVIANARGGENPVTAPSPAFTSEECEAVTNWVREGGSLLLIADHAPFGAAAGPLARALGVDMRSAYTADTDEYDKEAGNNSFLVFSRDNKLLGEHPITAGRNPEERIKRVVTFTGQSLKGPEGSVEILKLSDTAFDMPAPTQAQVQEAIAKARAEAKGGGGGAIRMRMPTSEKISAAGRAQGLAFALGRGRVVVLGEAAVLSAQIMKVPGEKDQHFGMNRAGSDDRQFALNIVHWLSRLI